jgi:hypothetical protein
MMPKVVQLTYGVSFIFFLTLNTKNHLTTSVAKMDKEHKAVMHNNTASFL